MIDQGTEFLPLTVPDAVAGHFRSSGDDPCPGGGKSFSDYYPARRHATPLTSEQAR